MGVKIFVVDFNQLPAGTYILPVNAQKRFHCLLLQAAKAQKLFQRTAFPVNIPAVQAVQRIGKLQAGTALLQKRDIKRIAVKMDEGGKLAGPGKEGGKNLFFRFFGIRKPLSQIPGALLVPDAADQIDEGRIGGETGGFNVKKKEASQGGRFWLNHSPREMG